MIRCCVQRSDTCMRVNLFKVYHAGKRVCIIVAIDKIFNLLLFRFHDI